MSAAGEQLVTAVRSLIPTQWAHYAGEVDIRDPQTPWIVSNIGVPDDEHKSEGAHVAAGDLDVYLTVAGSSEAQARVVLQAVVDAFSGALIPPPPGWLIGRLVQYQKPRLYSTDVDLDGAPRHLFTGVVGYRATCSYQEE